MEVEQKQAEYIDYFVKQASNLKGQGLTNIITEATSHPSLFAFSEILSIPNVLELEGTEYGNFLVLLRIFAHGTWSEYKNDANSLPNLAPDQVLKLKQLTVLSLAETEKVLPYDELMKELDVASVRELEDFLINDCMYVGIVKGKLDQFRRCFEVQFAAGRDLRPDQLCSMIDLLSNWLSTSDDLLVSIQEKIKWADSMNEMHKNHKNEIDAKMDEAKKTLSLKGDSEFRGNEDVLFEPMGMMDYDEDRVRSKRRRHPIG